MPTDYKYKRMSNRWNDAPKSFDFKTGCLFPLIAVIIIVVIAIAIGSNQ